MGEHYPTKRNNHRTSSAISQSSIQRSLRIEPIGKWQKVSEERKGSSVTKEKVKPSTNIGEELTPQQRQQMTELLHKYQDIFTTDYGNLLYNSLYHYSINTGDAIPIQQKSYRILPPT